MARRVLITGGSGFVGQWLSRAALQQNNRLGIFDNLADTQEALSTLLNESFALVNRVVVGSVAVFSARKATRTDRAADHSSKM